ncbi:hypothetical protein OHA98_23295 [Streptomyces sp. NBC_00654]|uniref:hypothetical protein n=1 Tax=Streptomyces sp. NBC_00654 TaxID=2975799 RepID=UPI0022578A11|nr:hypothetical protein [Streptomyces sp. NBC_00654]MCX4967629.1 hypothetical protein [Streptomyces sp. NBC_00654]
MVASPLGAALTERFGARLSMTLGMLHTAVTVAGVLCLLGAALAAVGLRRTRKPSVAHG